MRKNNGWLDLNTSFWCHSPNTQSESLKLKLTRRYRNGEFSVVALPVNRSWPLSKREGTTAVLKHLYLLSGPVLSKVLSVSRTELNPATKTVSYSCLVWQVYWKHGPSAWQDSSRNMMNSTVTVLVTDLNVTQPFCCLFWGCCCCFFPSQRYSQKKKPRLPSILSPSVFSLSLISSHLLKVAGNCSLTVLSIRTNGFTCILLPHTDKA